MRSSTTIRDGWRRLRSAFTSWRASALATAGGPATSLRDVPRQEGTAPPPLRSPGPEEGATFSARPSPEPVAGPPNEAEILALVERVVATAADRLTERIDRRLAAHEEALRGAFEEQLGAVGRAAECWQSEVAGRLDALGVEICQLGEDMRRGLSEANAAGEQVGEAVRELSGATQGVRDECRGLANTFELQLEVTEQALGALREEGEGRLRAVQEHVDAWRAHEADKQQRFISRLGEATVALESTLSVSSTPELKRALGGARPDLARDGKSALWRWLRHPRRSYEGLSQQRSHEALLRQTVRRERQELQALKVDLLNLAGDAIGGAHDEWSRSRIEEDEWSRSRIEEEPSLPQPRGSSVLAAQAG